MDQLKNTDTQNSPLLSLVVIAFNEARHIETCLQSTLNIDLPNEAFEVIFVDGGSTDDTVQKAQAIGPHHVLTSDTPRRAALNRNAGLHHAQGEYVQFVDGDMELDPQWPKLALDYIQAHPKAAAVSGILQERNTSVFYQALQLDWESPEGPIPYCGGAALFHRETLLAAGGFPEDVSYGEEPYLCWKLRNEHQKEIHHLNTRMAHHDLAYTGLLDYFKRNIRVGETYREIANRLKDTNDPLWSKEVQSTMAWALMLIFLLLGLLTLIPQIQLTCLILLMAILGRKTLQRIHQGASPTVALLYSLHIYSTKLTHCFGILKRGNR